MQSLPNPSVAARLVPLAAVLLAMVSITTGASFGKSMFPVVGPIGTTVFRLGFAAVILALLLRVWRARPTVRLWSAVVYGGTMAGMNLLFYMAIARIPLGIALAIEFIGPLAVAVLFSRRKSHFLWVGLALVGLAFVMPVQPSDTSLDPLGVAFAFAAGLFWAAYILAGQRAGADHGAQAPAIGMIIAALMVLPVGVADAGGKLLTPEILGLAVVVAVLSSAVPYTLEMFALRRLPARSFGILTSCEPAIGAVMGFLLLDESLPLLKCVGIGLVVVASLGTTLGERPSAVPHTEEAGVP